MAERPGDEAGAEDPRADDADTPATRSSPMAPLLKATSSVAGAVSSPADDEAEGIYHSAQLSGTDFTGASLAEADFSSAYLDDADFSDATLNEAAFYNASLVGTEFSGARLLGADLSEADARRASFVGTRAARADFESACLVDASFDDAELCGANLRGADLSGATLLRTDLRGARYDRSTRWPEGFELTGLGLVFSSEETLDASLRSLRPGRPYPLGATWDGMGVNFALFAYAASHVELCLFDSAEASSAAARIRMPEQTDGIWHLYVPNLAPGQLYAFRVYGPYRPERGARFNPNKLVLDPYAKALSGELEWDDALFGYTVGHPDQDLSFDELGEALDV